MTPTQVFQTLSEKIKRQWWLAFFSAIGIGLLIHMPALLSDIPNHDGLASMYFDQNMITSGRWFLSVACGFSSYYTVPWVIGLLGLLFLGMAAAAVTELLEVDRGWAIVLNSGLLVAFPALASSFAYVFTLDGYMLALLLAVLAVLVTKKYKWGLVGGAFCLAFSLGIYQAYLAFAMILSLFAVLMLFAEKKSAAEKITGTLRYLGMGILGVALYYGILQVLLRVQGKELASYQGIDGMASGNGVGAGGLLHSLRAIYQDFAAFTLKGNVLYNNWISFGALILLALMAVATATVLVQNRKWWKNLWFFVIIVVMFTAVPLVTNVILLISPDVTYHLLMRYQWVLYLIGLITFVSKNACLAKKAAVLEWGAFLAAFALIFFYGVTDNIGYSNLQKKYEKTYAYCVRLLDRIEQTEGYYPGIPIAMVGMIGTEQYPATDLTLSVTGNMIGLSGDSLVYTGENYQEFIKNYLGATLNILPPEAMSEVYYSEEYISMDSFPGEDSIRIIDGIMYIKTENVNR
ncbi:MAG: glucosyltransferase domain-containing protein [Acetatifactor sp.]|nr:glucosyltransferase domain-containing protein [Acetatifactor sp.]